MSTETATTERGQPMSGPQVVALFSIAADQTERSGKTYDEWVRAVTARFQTIAECVSS